MDISEVLHVTTAVILVGEFVAKANYLWCTRHPGYSDLDDLSRDLQLLHAQHARQKAPTSVEEDYVLILTQGPMFSYCSSTLKGCEGGV